MARKRKAKRKPMPRPSRPFASRRDKAIEAAWRKALADYHATFMCDE